MKASELNNWSFTVTVCYIALVRLNKHPENILNNQNILMLTLINGSEFGSLAAFDFVCAFF